MTDAGKAGRNVAVDIFLKQTSESTCAKAKGTRRFRAEFKATWQNKTSFNWAR